jgi:hypothetical protein
MGNRVVSAKRLPVCEVTSNAVGVATNFPIGLNYEELLYWYWVPNWNHATIYSISSASSSVTDDNLNTTSASTSFVPSVVGGYYKYENPITITNENKLVCSGIYGLLQRQFDNGSCTEQIDGKYACVTVTIKSSIVVDFNQINLHNNLYYPYVYAEILGFDFLQIYHPELEEGSNFGFGWATYNPVENPTPTTTDWSSIPLNVFNKTAYIYGGISDYGLHTGYSYSLPSSLSLFPTSYWPYASRAGTAIYDTLTGAQLQSPFA